MAEVVGQARTATVGRAAQMLAAGLPEHWCVVLGRAWPSSRGCPFDVVVLGGRGVLVLDVLDWGPHVLAEADLWTVAGEERCQPMDRVSYLARSLAGRLGEDPDSGAVAWGVLLTHPRLNFESGTTSGAVPGEVLLTATAAGTVVDLDARVPSPVDAGRARSVVTALPAAGPDPARLGPYRVVQRLAPSGAAQRYLGVSAHGAAVLRCHPPQGAGTSSADRVRREAAALRRLADASRAPRPAAWFVDGTRSRHVLPVPLPPDQRTLVHSRLLGDPPRTVTGRGPSVGLGHGVLVRVVADGFRALASVHAEGLVHGALHPRRVDLGKGLRVRFTGFSPGDDGDVSRAPAGPERGFLAPERRHGTSRATSASDVYELAASLAWWASSQAPAEPCRVVLDDVAPPVRELLERCLHDDPAARPSAAQAATAFDVGDVVHDGARGPAHGTAPGPGRFTEGAVVAGRYTLKRRLGAGSNAITWLAYDERHQDNYVLKQFRDRRAAGLAQQEFAAAKELAHDRCARVWDISAEPEPGFLVHQYVEGSSLADHAREGLLDVPALQHVALNLLDALAYMHDKDMVHGDISANNVVVTPGGDGVLIDFGLAGRTGRERLGGTPVVMAPEALARGALTPASDVYCLAATLLRVMLGRPPYAGEPADGPGRDSTPVPPSDDERRQWGAHGASLLDVLFTGVAVDPAGRPTARQLARLVAATREPDGEPEPYGGAVVVPGGRVENPTVEHLRRLYRGSTAGNAGNRGLDDVFARRTYVATRLDAVLLPQVLAGTPRVVVLSGNPGDGKTSFLVRVGEALRASGARTLDEGAWGWRTRLAGHTYAAVLDASASSGQRSSDEVLHAALDPGEGVAPWRHTALVAANDGRLQQFVSDHRARYPQLARAVEAAADRKPGPPDVLVVDLKRRALVGADGTGGPAVDLARAFTAPDLWQVCAGCRARDHCPLLRNARALHGPAAQAWGELVLTSHLRRRRRATFRDVRSALAWLVTGDRSCADVHACHDRGLDPTWDPAHLHDLAFAPKTHDALVHEWRDLDPALVAAPEVERAARLDARLCPDPASFTRRHADTAQRKCFMGTWTAPGVDRGAVRAYRHLGEFVRMVLHPDDPEVAVRLLQGVGRFVDGAGPVPGDAWTGGDLALVRGDPATRWAVVARVPASEFTVSTPVPPGDAVEWFPDRLTLRHRGGAALTFTLDTAETVLRAADGEVAVDVHTDGVRHDVQAFVDRIGPGPAHPVDVVDPVGRAARVVREGTSVRLLADGAASSRTSHQEGPW